MTMASIDLAVIDGDMVIWDSTARMSIADQAAQIAQDIIEQFSVRFAHLVFTLDEKERKKMVEAARWRVAFDPALIELDRNIVRNTAHTAILTAAGWEVVILSSNPEYTRERRQRWLREHGYDKTPLILKDTGTDDDPRDRYIKTPTWKVNQVYHLLEQFGDQAVRRLLFVDDMQKNRDAIMEAFGSSPSLSLIVADSLDAAIAMIFPMLVDSQDYKYRINPEG